MDPTISLTLEHPLLKVPYERGGVVLRSSHKAVEKEFVAITKELHKMAAKGSRLRCDRAESVVASMVKRMQGLKRKLETLHGDEERHVSTLRQRVDYLQTFATPPGRETVHRWEQSRADRVLLDYLLREGRFETASALAEDASLQACSDIELFRVSEQVVADLRQRQCVSALAWCQEHRMRLKKLKCPLEFNIRLQQFLELVRDGKPADAIAYSRKYLAPQASSQMQQIQRVMATLAFPQGSRVERYAELFAHARWDDLVKQFHQAFFQVHSLTSESLLSITMQAGLAALKNRQCYQEDTRNFNCPTCAPLMNQLAKPLPYSLHTHSSLVCRISGDLMDEDNPPMVLPNGHVYSKNAVDQRAADSGGSFVDPRTGETFPVQRLKKAFIS